jgi:hypothetical protein
MEDSNIAKHMLLNLKLSYLTMSSSTQIHIYSETKRKTVTGLPIFLYELQYPPVLKRVMENLPCVDDFPIETSTGWWSTYPSEKYEFVNGKDDPIYEMENIKCSKPPTSPFIGEFQLPRLTPVLDRRHAVDHTLFINNVTWGPGDS